MKFARYDQETAYQAGVVADGVARLKVAIDFMTAKLERLVELEQELFAMQKEMFEDYKKVKDKAHVKLQGDMEGNHATAYPA